MPRAVQRLSLAVFLGCLIDAIEQGTGTKCYDSPENRASPLYSVELQNAQPENTKTMYIDAISVWVHCISEPVRPYSNAKVLGMIQRLEQALADGFELPEPFSLYRTTFDGVQTLKKDETDEGHAIVGVTFRVCYGLRVK